MLRFPLSALCAFFQEPECFRARWSALLRLKPVCARSSGTSAKQRNFAKGCNQVWQNNTQRRRLSVRRPRSRGGHRPTNPKALNVPHHPVHGEAHDQQAPKRSMSHTTPFTGRPLINLPQHGPISTLAVTWIRDLVGGLPVNGACARSSGASASGFVGRWPPRERGLRTLKRRLCFQVCWSMPSP